MRICLWYYYSVEQFSKSEEEQMARNSKSRSLMLPFIIGIVSGITAKLVDVPYITADHPIFDDMMGRFGIWVWAAAIIAIRSRTAFLAAARSFVFFAGMLAAYYSYTVIVLNFFPGSQIILWSCIGMATPFCGFLIWHVRRKRYYADFIASLPFSIFFTEWYLTAFSAWNWSAKDKWLLFIVYVWFSVSLLAVLPTNRRRLFSLVYGAVISMILISLIQAGIIVNPYAQLLNV